MVCPKCGAKVNEGDNFCEECGTSLKTAIHDNCKVSNEAPMSDLLSIDSNLAVGSNIGIRHPKNEDSGTVMKCGDGTIMLIIADGVSSAVNAVSASQLAVNKVKDLLSEGGNDADLIKAAINEANKMIIDMPYEIKEDGIYGPESTIAAAAFKGDTAIIGWVGDSRAYRISQTSQKLLTVDDSWVELVVASGEMTRSEAMTDRRSHYVTQVLGMHDQPLDVHIIRERFEKDEMLLLCSDGLWNYLSGEDDLRRAVMDFGMERNAKDICEYLINIANRSGGHDNITVAIYKNV